MLDKFSNESFAYGKSGYEKFLYSKSNLGDALTSGDFCYHNCVGSI